MAVLIEIREGELSSELTIFRCGTVVKEENECVGVFGALAMIEETRICACESNSAIIPCKV